MQVRLLSLYQEQFPLGGWEEHKEIGRGVGGLVILFRVLLHVCLLVKPQQAVYL